MDEASRRAEHCRFSWSWIPHAAKRRVRCLAPRNVPTKSLRDDGSATKSLEINGRSVAESPPLLSPNDTRNGFPNGSVQSLHSIDYSLGTIHSDNWSSFPFASLSTIKLERSMSAAAPKHCALRTLFISDHSVSSRAADRRAK